MERKFLRWFFFLKIIFASPHGNRKRKKNDDKAIIHTCMAKVCAMQNLNFQKLTILTSEY